MYRTVRTAAMLLSLIAAVVLVIMFATAPSLLASWETSGVPLSPGEAWYAQFLRWGAGPFLGRLGNPDQLVPGLFWAAVLWYLVVALPLRRLDRRRTRRLQAQAHPRTDTP